MSIPLYLWVSHGTNVSTEHNYYPYNAKFKYITMYSRLFESIYPDLLESIESGKDVCKLFLGTPSIPITDCKTGIEYTYLPPILFFSKTDDHETIKRLSGLYYLEVNKYGNDICKITKIRLILNHAGIIQMYGNGNNITYSKIFKKVYDDCIEYQINSEDVVLGLYNCQTAVKYVSNYNQTTAQSLLAKRIEPLSLQVNFYNRANLISMQQTIPPVYLYPTIIPIYKLQNWETLAGIRYQGCGLNVLSYYNIIDENEAREKITCLPIQGSSIFSLVEYINIFLKKFPDFNNTLGYVVVRYTIPNSFIFLKQLFDHMKQFNFAIIVKTYSSIYRNGTTSINHIGHTFSFACFQGKYYHIDPQANIFRQIDFSEGTGVSGYMDIVFSVTNNVSSGELSNIHFTVAQFLQITNDSTIVEKEQKINYGGGRRYKNKKTRWNNNQNNKNNKNNNNKNNNNKNNNNKNNQSKRKRKIKRGGEPPLDNYEKIVYDIDGDKTDLLDNIPPM